MLPRLEAKAFDQVRGKPSTAQSSSPYNRNYMDSSSSDVSTILLREERHIFHTIPLIRNGIYVLQFLKRANTGLSRPLAAASVVAMVGGACLLSATSDCAAATGAGWSLLAAAILMPLFDQPASVVMFCLGALAIRGFVVLKRRSATGLGCVKTPKHENFKGGATIPRIEKAA